MLFKKSEKPPSKATLLDLKLDEKTEINRIIAT